jgi:hypothetical protein
VSLSSSKLSNELVKLAISGGFPRDPYEAGKRWAHAYALYAADAMSIPPTAAPPASLAAGEATLAALLGALWTSSRSAPQSANGMASGLTAFWLAPPVVFGAGLVTAVTGTSALASALQGIWASNQSGKQSADFCAKKVAAAIHAFTLTVITTTPSGGGPVIGAIT